MPLYEEVKEVIKMKVVKNVLLTMLLLGFIGGLLIVGLFALLLA